MNETHLSGGDICCNKQTWNLSTIIQGKRLVVAYFHIQQAVFVRL